MNKKKVFFVALAICLVAILSVGSLAWFSDADDVTNKFMIANSDEEPDDIFSVDVWEYVDGDTENKDQDGHTYEHIVPGSSYHKEPYVENTGIHDQYIRVTLTIQNAKLFGEDFNYLSLFGGYDSNAWTTGESAYDEAANTYTMEFYLNSKLAPGEVVCLFNEVNIPEYFTQYNSGFELDIFAEAVQVANLGDTAQGAFAIVDAE